MGIRETLAYPRPLSRALLGESVPLPPTAALRKLPSLGSLVKGLALCLRPRAGQPSLDLRMKGHLALTASLLMVLLLIHGTSFEVLSTMYFSTKIASKRPVTTLFADTGHLIAEHSLGPERGLSRESRTLPCLSGPNLSPMGSLIFDIRNGPNNENEWSATLAWRSWLSPIARNVTEMGDSSP